MINDILGFFMVITLIIVSGFMIRDFKISLNQNTSSTSRFITKEDKTYLLLSCPMMLISIIEFALIIITFVYCCQTICLRNQITGGANNLKRAAVLYSQNPDANFGFSNQQQQQPNNFGIYNPAFSGSIEKTSCSEENGKYI